jgi:ubiquinone biosynthesis protein
MMIIDRTLGQLRAGLRVWRIAAVAMRWRLDEITPLARVVAPFAAWMPQAAEARGLSRGARLKRALEELGPIFVKFGQILSTRRDLLPWDIADELASLQDRVLPFPGAQARAAVEKALGAPIAELYASFDETPLASASIAQVHAATLHDGRAVVVKVLRPTIRLQIEADLALLHALAGIAERRLSAAERIRPRAIVTEIERTLRDELELLREGASGSLLRRNFSGSPDLYVPEMIWTHSKDGALTMERVYGTPLNDLPALREQGVDFELLAKKAIQLFYTQVFRDNFFHADLHPGNLLVEPGNPTNPRYIALDFGIMGQLPAVDQRYLAENFMAMFTKDYRRIAELHLESGWMPPSVRVDELEGAVRTICEPYFSRPLSEVNLGEVMLKLFELAHRHQLIVQPQLILLQKTLFNVEGLARLLAPGIDLWAVAQPVLAELMRERYGAPAAFAEMRRRLPGWIQQTPELPRLVYEYLRQSTEGERRVQIDSSSLKALVREQRRTAHRLVYAVLGAGLTVSASLLYVLDGDAQRLLGLPVSAWLALLAAIGVLLAARRA